MLNVLWSTLATREIPDAIAVMSQKKDSTASQAVAAVDKWLEGVPELSLLLQWLGRSFNPLLLSAAVSTVDCSCGRRILEPLDLALQMGVARSCPECRKTPFLRHETYGERMRQEFHPRLNQSDVTAPGMFQLYAWSLAEVRISIGTFFTYFMEQERIGP